MIRMRFGSHLVVAAVSMLVLSARPGYAAWSADATTYEGSVSISDGSGGYADGTHVPAISCPAASDGECELEGILGPIYRPPTMQSIFKYIGDVQASISRAYYSAPTDPSLTVTVSLSASALDSAYLNGACMGMPYTRSSASFGMLFKNAYGVHDGSTDLETGSTTTSISPTGGTLTAHLEDYASDYVSCWGNCDFEANYATAAWVGFSNP